MATLSDDVKSFRLQMSRYERSNMWLSLLLDCYAMIDFSVSKSIEQSEKKVACYKGCSVCCYQVIPLSTIECMGIKFYVQNILNQRFRSFLIKKFNEHKSICLFNIDDCCIVYSLRPIACRRYIVCSKPCEINEDPIVTRSSDVLESSREHLYCAIEMTLAFYKHQNIHLQDGEHIFDFYKRQNVKLSSVYESIINDL